MTLTVRLRGVVESFGGRILTFIDQLGELLIFGRSFFTWLLVAPFRGSLILRQMDFVGVRSFPIIVLTATFTGMVFALQSGYAFRLFHAEPLIGSTVGLALSRELGPVFTALMVTARAGSAMAAEIGTMRVTEQVDALMAMAVEPIHYLVVPRVVASTLMLPLLSGVFVSIGLVGAYFVSVFLLGVDANLFVQKLLYYVDANDIVGGLIKSMVFGFTIGLISCHRGYRATGGAEGVGRATTQAVVLSCVTILVLDYFLTSWILEYFPEF